MNKRTCIGLILVACSGAVSVPALAETSSISERPINGSPSERSMVEQDAAVLHKKRMEYHKEMGKILSMDKSEYQDEGRQHKTLAAKRGSLPHTVKSAPFCQGQQLVRHAVLQAGG